MIRATVKTLGGKSLDHGDFTNETNANEWFAPLINRGVFGIKSDITIEFEDISQEIETRNNREIARSILKEKILNTKRTDLSTVAKVADFLIELRDFIKEGA